MSTDSPAIRPNGTPATLRAAIADSIADWGGATIDSITTIGDLSLFTVQVAGWLFGRLPRYETLLPNFYQVGVLSLPVIALTGTFIGMVLAVQSYFTFRDLGLETRLGAVINMTLVRELGPVLAATMLAGRVGCAMAAELGTMRVTEQIDALESMGANPIHYLVVPRFLASLFMIPALTIMADFMGVVGGYLYSIHLLQIDEHHYWKNSESFVQLFDLFSGIFKSVFFGAAIALVSCYRGFHCTPGAEGVGQSRQQSAQAANACCTHRQTDRAAQHRDQRALGQQLPDQMPPPGPDGHADGHLAPTRRSPGQKQVGQVGARDQQHQPDRHLQDHQRTPDRRIHADGVERTGRGAPPGHRRSAEQALRLRMGGIHPGAQQALHGLVGPVPEFAELVDGLAVAVAGQVPGPGGVVEAVHEPVGGELVQPVAQAVVGHGHFGTGGGEFA